MAKEEKKVTEEEEEAKVGLVTLTGTVGMGMKLPDGNIIELKEDGIGQMQLLEHIIIELSDIKKSIA